MVLGVGKKSGIRLKSEDSVPCTIQFEVKRPVTQIKLRKQEFREFYINKVELLQTTDRSEKSCHSSLTIPSISRLIKTGQSKPFLEVKDQKSVCMNKNHIVTTDLYTSYRIPLVQR